MQHFIVSQAGAPLQLANMDLRAPEPNEVQIKVLAAGVSFADVLIRHGLYPVQPAFPLIPGYEVVGVIEKVGTQAPDLSEGQLIASLAIVGGYAEQINLPATDVVVLPTDLNSVEAVSIVLNYLTAYQILHRTLRVQRGERILIHSAAGGVGTALLQLGKLAGLEMFGTASRNKLSLVEQLGAIPIDYQRDDFVERIYALTKTGVDIVLDPIGGEHLQQSYRALNKQGRLVAFGTLASFKNGTPQRLVLEAYKSSIEQFNQQKDGRQALSYSLNAIRSAHFEWIRDDLTTLYKLLAAGAIHPVIDRCLPLTEAPLAHEMLEMGKVAGKLVLICH